jgi:hypothetical protein
MELRNQLPRSHPLTAPVHPLKRVTGPPELHHWKGRYQHLIHLREKFLTFSLHLGRPLLVSQNPNCLPPINPALACDQKPILP